MTEEKEWKDIPGMPFYQASTCGFIRSLPGKHKYDRKHGCCILRTTTNQFGHLKVSVRGKMHYVHRLVAMTFLSRDNNMLVVNHKDFNPKNNSVENLEWVTRRQNTRHSALAFRYSVLTKEQVSEILPLRGDKSSYELAKKYGVSASTIQRAWIRFNPGDVV